MRWLYKIISLFTIALTFLIYLGWNQGWVLGVLGLGFPVLIGFHVVCLIFILFFSPRILGWTLFVFASFLLLLPRSYQFGTKLPDDFEEGVKEISVLSYNVGNYSKNKQQTAAYLTWLTGQGADVLLLPEYSNYDLAHHGTLGAIKKNYRYHHTLEHKQFRNLKNTARLTVFSRYPILFAKDTLFQHLNGIVQADIAVGKDTVSFFGVHLFSMSLEIDKLVKKKEKSELEKGGIAIVRKIKKGFHYREGEVDLLKQWIKEARYPVIVGGDFNETPYSYSYSQISRSLSNAYEDGGAGFGFTFNSLPYFIRIDQQFYDANRLELLKFETHQDVYFSDHFPIQGVYRLR